MTTPSVPTEIIEAMRSVQTESDRWRLAEILAKAVPDGTKGFAEIIDAANAEGVGGGLSVNTLRLYRDTAKQWPADKRVPNVSFSAHREVQVLPTTAAGVKVLTALVKAHGAGNVTVAEVRKAVKIQRGIAPAEKAEGDAKAQPKAVLDILADLKAGSPALIAAIPARTQKDQLDQIHAGLVKALAHVEDLRGRAARAAAKKAAAPSTRRTASTTAKPPAPKAPAKPKAAPATRRPKGDLRDV
jgi:hypothetical protein